MYYTLICYTAGVLVAAAIAYRFLHYVKKSYSHKSHLPFYKPLPDEKDISPLEGVEHDFVCCLRGDGTGGKTTVRRISKQPANNEEMVTMPSSFNRVERVDDPGIVRFVSCNMRDAIYYHELTLIEKNEY
jgi:hypothetical protein